MSNIIFDFDGTLADSLDLIMSVFYEVTGVKPVSEAELRQIQKMPMRKIAKHFGIHWWQVPGLLSKGRKIMASRIDEIKIYPGIEKMVKDLHGKDHKLYVITSNSTSNVKKVLKRYDINKYFGNIYGGAGLLGKGRILKTAISSHKWPKEDCLYVGDEVRDIECAFEAGVRCVSVEWGFSDKGALKLLNPHAMIAKPSELVKIVDKKT